MAYRLQRSGLVWLGVGLCLGLVFAGIFPHTPLHATSNDRYDDFAIATGAVDRKHGGHLFPRLPHRRLEGCRRRPTCGSSPPYQTNIRNDLGGDSSKASRYMMVTGMRPDIRGVRGNARPAMAILYVANCHDGRIGAYNFAWDKNSINMGRKILGQPIVLMDVFQARTAIIAPGSKP